jgi:hypothetical protein
MPTLRRTLEEQSVDTLRSPFCRSYAPRVVRQNNPKEVIVRRLLAASLVAAIAVPAFAGPAAGAMASTGLPGQTEATVDTNGSLCDPMNDSAIAEEIAMIEAELARLEARAAALRAELYARSLVTSRLNGEVASAFNALVRWDNQYHAWWWWLVGPIAGSPVRQPPHPEDLYGPRADLVHAWVVAQMNLRKEYAVIDQILADLREVGVQIDFARMRLAELEAERFAQCHDQPAPPTLLF